MEKNKTLSRYHNLTKRNKKTKTHQRTKIDNIEHCICIIYVRAARISIKTKREK